MCPTNKLALIAGHTWYAMAAALLFAAGMMCSVPVLRWRVELFLRFPRWLAGVLRALVESGISVPALALFIFCFNGAAIFIYMMTGVIPGMPAAVAFFTGLHVALASVMGAEQGGVRRLRGRLPVAARLCAALTFLIELPCFFYSVGMGWGMEVGLTDLLRGAETAPLTERAEAYATVILPLLAVSALAESYAVCAGRERMQNSE